jgi:hypothetical protein
MITSEDIFMEERKLHFMKKMAINFSQNAIRMQEDKIRNLKKYKTYY